MASSFSSQIPVILHLLGKLQPKSVLDVGKGFGKYGFLLHEYVGIDNAQRPQPTLSLRDQSRIVIDAVESNPDYMWPHLDQIYRQVYSARIEDVFKSGLPAYDLVLMIDVIEHLTKESGLDIVRHFIHLGYKVIMSTPRRFFQQELYGSDDEHHLSHWTPSDFNGVCKYDYQNCDDGQVFLLSREVIDIRGFGHSPIKRLRRIARALHNELP
jgi:2-polyprenyl-3-methyl-5-hydroxy-6-metoxy-1,4-benzoquinol methylase